MVVSILSHNFVNTFFLTLLEQQCHKFSKGYDINVFTQLSFTVFVLETLKFEWQCSQYLEFNSTCVINCIWKISLKWSEKQPRSEIFKKYKIGFVESPIPHFSRTFGLISGWQVSFSSLWICYKSMSRKYLFEYIKSCNAMNWLGWAALHLILTSPLVWSVHCKYALMHKQQWIFNYLYFWDMSYFDVWKPTITISN